MGIGSLTKLGISKGVSIGRELFGFLMRSDLNVAKIAEGAGVTLDTLESAPLEDLSAILERAARSGAIDPRRANNINIQLAKDAQEVAPDNVVSFSDAKNDQMVSKIKGAIQNMPYTMNLPYEIGQKLNSEGKLPLPIGTNLLPLGGKGYPDEVHKIIGYKGDIYNPALYGYEVQAPNGDIFFQAISDPASGLRQQRADKVGSFTAALGPEGLTGMRFVPPSRPVRQAVEGPQISEAEQKVIDQEYNDLFGDFE
jgi:hypothetical protein